MNKKFSFIFAPAQSFQHLLTRKDVKRCWESVREHMTCNGAFLIQIFNPSFSILMKDPRKRTPTNKDFYFDNELKTKYYATVQSKYDIARQILYTKYFYQSDDDPVEKSFTLTMRQFFPQEIDTLVEDNGFEIIAKYGDNKRTPFEMKPDYQNLLLKKK